MASITVRNLDPALKERLRIRAAGSSRSMEAEAREILKTALAESSDDACDLAEIFQSIFRPLGGFDMPAIERSPVPEPPTFD